MSEQPYTPTTNEVRNAYRLSDQELDGVPYLPEKSDAEFDRWLDQVKADAWEKAVYHLEPFIGSQKRREAMADNPYRQEADR